MTNEKQATQNLDQELIQTLREYTGKYGVHGDDGHRYIPTSWLAGRTREHLEKSGLITRAGNINQLGTTIPRRYNGKTVYYRVELENVLTP